MPEYVLTRSAESDLIEIARYTRREWGERQRDKYIRELFDLFAAIAATPHLSQNRDRIRPDLKSRRHKKRTPFISGLRAIPCKSFVFSTLGRT